MRYRTLAEFWPYYVSEHSRSGTRLLHFIGTSLLIVCLGATVALRNWAFLPIGIVLAYGFAWIGHFVIEKNRPATFQYPFLSLVADFKMYGFMWAGKMNQEIERLQS